MVPHVGEYREGVHERYTVGGRGGMLAINNVSPLATDSCSVTQKDLFSTLFTNHKNLAVLMK